MGGFVAVQGLRARLAGFTPMLAWMTVYLSLAALNFGYDVGVFSGLQAMQPFCRRFGDYNSSTGLYALPPWLSSLMNSLPFLGKLIGALACGPLIERWGRRVGILVLACLSLIGVTLQISATSAAQFTVGRVINFGMTGMVIVVTPIYMGECSPPSLRGLISSTIQFQIAFGQLIASLINLRTQTFTTDVSWRLPVGLQFIVPVIILAFLYTMPESPRWLLSKGQTVAAATALQSLRGKNAALESIDAELDDWNHAASNHGKGAWRDLFTALNRRRTTIAVLAMFFQQITGQAFVSQYGVVFYQQQHIDHSFLWATISSIGGLAAVVLNLLFVDAIGRRPLMFTGGSLMALFMFLIAGIGGKANPTQADKNVVIASVILFGTSYGLSWATASYIVLSEVARSSLKEKTNDLAVAISVITTFVVSFTLPYLLNAPYAALGPKVGWIYGSSCVAAVVVAFLVIPEMKGRSLEEIDKLFEMGLPAWRWNGAVVNADDVYERQEDTFISEDIGKSPYIGKRSTGSGASTAIADGAHLEIVADHRSKTNGTSSKAWRD